MVCTYVESGVKLKFFYFKNGLRTIDAAYLRVHLHGNNNNAKYVIIQAKQREK